LTSTASNNAAQVTSRQISTQHLVKNENQPALKLRLNYIFNCKVIAISSNTTLLTAVLGFQKATHQIIYGIFVQIILCLEKLYTYDCQFRESELEWQKQDIF
jgi:hypothetical protein